MAAPRAKKPTPAKKKPTAKKTPAKKTAQTTAPWHRMAYDKGGFGLFFDVMAFESIGAFAVFEAAGAYGNGYGWESVLAPAFERAHPSFASAIDYDCEADTFSARADSEATLDALAGVIAAVTATPQALAAAVSERDPDRD